MAAQRIQAGEPFDLVLLAADAIDHLMATGHVHAGSRIDLMRSPVAVAVKAGMPVPGLNDAAAVRLVVIVDAHAIVAPERAKAATHT